jgi:hypothetical protein
MQLNNLPSCCRTEDSDCYMIHYDSRCYCDSVCSSDSSDCCQDAKRTCAVDSIVKEPIVTKIIEENEGEKIESGDEPVIEAESKEEEKTESKFFCKFLIYFSKNFNKKKKIRKKTKK